MRRVVVRILPYRRALIRGFDRAARWYVPGDTVTVSASHARELVRDGHAERVRSVRF